MSKHLDNTASVKFEYAMFWLPSYFEMLKLVKKLVLMDFDHPNIFEWMTQHVEMQISAIGFSDNPWHEGVINCTFKSDRKRVGHNSKEFGPHKFLLAN